MNIYGQIVKHLVEPKSDLSKQDQVCLRGMIRKHIREKNLSKITSGFVVFQSVNYVYTPVGKDILVIMPTDPPTLNDRFPIHWTQS